MLTGSKRMTSKVSYHRMNVFIDNKEINQIYEYKTLRVTVDKNLSYKSNTAKKIAKK